MASSNDLVPILLLPQHITPDPFHLPLLHATQKVLNDGYQKTYCEHPEIFGTSYLRLADPAQLAHTIGPDGFTIVLVRTLPSETIKARLCEVVATGSIKDFGDGNVEDYAKWSKAVTGTQWKAKGPIQEVRVGDTPGERRIVHRYEVTAFAVAPSGQAGGLGARILKEMEWLIETEGGGTRLQYAFSTNVPLVECMEIRGENGDHSPVQGIDLNRLRKQVTSSRYMERSLDKKSLEKPKLVLMAIKELGSEAYYQRRGYKSVWSGVVPVGMFDCRKECTMVYMEKDV